MSRRRAEPLTPEHRELVTFVTEHWGRVKREVDQVRGGGGWLGVVLWLGVILWLGEGE